MNFKSNLAKKNEISLLNRLFITKNENLFFY